MTILLNFAIIELHNCIYLYLTNCQYLCMLSKKLAFYEMYSTHIVLMTKYCTSFINLFTCCRNTSFHILCTLSGVAPGGFLRFRKPVMFRLRYSNRVVNHSNKQSQYSEQQCSKLLATCIKKLFSAGN